ncbi:hypothetical protein EV191_10666 [Tamaricihabitans halophyticus]|uniref:Uncharacterized protein n=1 Tax=Tamaricihabitans halophyticus TaxID=1262583 RepID=A0A4R2QQ93_9PSEU|nr:hypothetical protein EV191_10666 [Tamaricihabitans halophyticus]
MFGLPVLTSLFVFGGFVAAVVLAVGFGLRFRSTDDEWAVLGKPYRTTRRR